MRSTFLVLAIFLGGVLSTRPAAATTFVLANTEHLLAASDAVVLGRVESIEGVSDGNAIRTNITLSVEHMVKGAYVPEVTIVEMGGLVADQRRWVFGTPTFFVGERVLLFLSRDNRDELHTTFLSMGKFSVVRSSDGAEFAVRDLGEAPVVEPESGRVTNGPHVTTHVLADLLQTLRNLSAGGGSGGSLANAHVARGSRWQTHFMFTGPPALRWSQPDVGQVVIYRVGADGDATLGAESSSAATNAALAVWGSPACTNLRLAPGDAAENAPFGTCDGQNQILFNDPASEIADPVDCVGVLAVGGVCAGDQDPLQFSGGSFYRITEGDVMVNNGFGGCPFWNPTNLAEILTHEIGHSIGLAHSSDDPNETDPVLRDATMYYAAHFDGRGARLEADDAAAVCALYPSGQTGSLRLRRFALVFDPSGRPASDRMVLDGVLTLNELRFSPTVDTLIFDVRVAGISLIHIAVQPALWRSNQDGTRYRYRGVTGTGRATLQLASDVPGVVRVNLQAGGLDLSAARMENVTMLMAAGGVGVTEAVTLRNESSARMYP